ncbi:hypothetical protein D3C80_1392230 [compost metagenome]
MTVAPGFLSTDPADAVVAVVRFGVLHRHHGITVGLLEVVLHFLVLRQRAPAGLVDLVSHLCRHRLAGELRAVKLDAPLHHAVAQQLIQPGIGPLDDHRRQRHHCLCGVLDDVAHDLLETLRGAIELVLQGVREVHVSAHHVGAP